LPPLHISFLPSASSTPYGCASSVRSAQASPALPLDCAEKSLPSVPSVRERFLSLPRAQSRLSRAHLSFWCTGTKISRAAGPPKRDARLRSSEIFRAHVLDQSNRPEPISILQKISHPYPLHPASRSRPSPRCPRASAARIHPPRRAPSHSSRPPRHAPSHSSRPPPAAFLAATPATAAAGCGLHAATTVSSQSTTTLPAVPQQQATAPSHADLKDSSPLYLRTVLHLIGRVYSIASYKISYFLATSIYDNFIH
jgi:hypothetical protein